MASFMPIALFLAVMALFWTFVFRGETSKDIRCMQNEISDLKNTIHKLDLSQMDRIHKLEMDRIDRMYKKEGK